MKICPASFFCNQVKQPMNQPRLFDDDDEGLLKPGHRPVKTTGAFLEFVRRALAGDKPFTPTQPYKLVRPSDPVTSHEAARSIDPTNLEQAVLNVIEGFGVRGCISDQVRASLPNLTYSSVTARYKALKERGMIFVDERKRKGNSGRNQRIMWSKFNYMPLPDKDDVE